LLFGENTYLGYAIWDMSQDTPLSLAGIRHHTLLLSRNFTSKYFNVPLSSTTHDRISAWWIHLTRSVGLLLDGPCCPSTGSDRTALLSGIHPNPLLRHSVCVGCRPVRVEAKERNESHSIDP
jgi:hypothetical protein